MLKGKFLIADDAFYIRKHLKSILKTRGFKNFEEASNGQEAVEKYKHYSPDIVFMDIIMPKEDGIDAIKDIIKFDENAHIIVLTAITQKEIILQAVDSGAKNYIIKPFTPEQVFRAIDEIEYAEEIHPINNAASI